MANDLEPNTMYEVVLVPDGSGRFRICVKDHNSHKLVDVTNQLMQQFSEPH